MRTKFHAVEALDYLLVEKSIVDRVYFKTGPILTNVVERLPEVYIFRFLIRMRKS